jgi:hypothetical protein
MSKYRQDFFAYGKNLSFRKSKSRYNEKVTRKKRPYGCGFLAYIKTGSLLK